MQAVLQIGSRVSNLRGLMPGAPERAAGNHDGTANLKGSRRSSNVSGHRQPLVRHRPRNAGQYFRTGYSTIVRNRRMRALCCDVNGEVASGSSMRFTSVIPDFVGNQTFSRRSAGDAFTNHPYLGGVPHTLTLRWSRLFSTKIVWLAAGSTAHKVIYGMHPGTRNGRATETRGRAARRCYVSRGRLIPHRGAHQTIERPT